MRLAPDNVKRDNARLMFVITSRPKKTVAVKIALIYVVRVDRIMCISYASQL